MKTRNPSISRYRRRRGLSTSIGILVSLCGARAHAQCMMDTDCKGDRICENGSCIAPAVVASPATSATAPRAAAGAAAIPATASPGVSVAPAAPHAGPSPLLVRHSQGMMVGGIVMVGLAPVGLAVTTFALLSETLCGFGDNSTASCNADGYIYGGLLSAAVLTAVGVPLIVIGAHKEPASPADSATVLPWVGRQSAGLSLRFSL